MNNYLTDEDMAAFLSAQKLPTTYANTARRWFDPLCIRLLKHHEHSKKPVIIGISGCQGSGKTTLSRYIETFLTSVYDKTVVSLSIDDFYLNQTERLALAKNTHPLLKTRGVPGTHDMCLALRTFERLQHGNRLHNGTQALLPRFDKATDNPYPLEQWPVIKSTPNFVILEGWCVGVKPQSEAALKKPINTLEEKFDAHGIWRSFVNTQLAGDYQTLFDKIDYLVFFKAPSFECVFHWRLEQERKLAQATFHYNQSVNNPPINKQQPDKQQHAIMTDAQIAAFVQHYQRLTEHALTTLPDKCDTVYYLDASRAIITQDHHSEL